MTDTLKPHPLAALFPELPREELKQLALDIKERGQLEPIILHQGLILDGRNRYRACQIAGVKPRFEEFNANATKRSQQFVLSRNLIRRHLSVGQKAAIALEWADQVQLRPKSDKSKTTGRPRGAVLEAAERIGIERQRVFEARQIREANPTLYREVKDGRRSLSSALGEISPPHETRSHKSDSVSSESTFQGVDWGAQHDMRPVAESIDSKRARESQKPAKREAAVATKPPPSRAAVEKALVRIKAILGTWFYAEVKGRNLIQKAEDIVQFSKLTDVEMREVGSVLKKGWTFRAALHEVTERLTPEDEIRALHTRTVAHGGNWYLISVGDFGHIVVWGPEKDKIIAKFRAIFGSYSVPQRS